MFGSKQSSSPATGWTYYNYDTGNYDWYLRYTTREMSGNVIPNIRIPFYLLRKIILQIIIIIIINIIVVVIIMI